MRKLSEERRPIWKRSAWTDDHDLPNGLKAFESCLTNFALLNGMWSGRIFSFYKMTIHFRIPYIGWW